MKISAQDKKNFKIRIVKCCKEHEKVNYKALEDLLQAQWEYIKDKEIDLAHCKQSAQRFAKLYIGYKRKYYGLYGLKEAAESIGVDTENPSKENGKFKDYKFSHKETQLESGRIKSEFFLTPKKKRKH